MKDDKEKSDIYRTSDLAISAYLQCAKCEIIDTERVGSRVFLIFRKGPSQVNKKLLDEYHNNKGRVPAKEFANNLRDLKTRVYSG